MTPKNIQTEIALEVVLNFLRTFTNVAAGNGKQRAVGIVGDTFSSRCLSHARAALFGLED